MLQIQSPRFRRSPPPLARPPPPSPPPLARPPPPDLARRPFLAQRTLLRPQIRTRRFHQRAILLLLFPHRSHPPQQATAFQVPHRLTPIQAPLLSRFLLLLLLICPVTTLIRRALMVHRRPPFPLCSSHLPLQQHPPGHGIAPPKSYAQAARSSKGPGFVRSHATEVESFARLPRTGVNIVCGSKEGIPSFSFVNSDLRAVENLYSNALIMKFHGGRPSLEASHKEIQSWGLESPFSIGPITSRAFLLRFQNNKDLIRVLSRPSSIIISFPYKVFRWHNLCHQLEDSCFAPVWISLPRLPLQCFIPEFLEAVANQIGRFLCLDIATSTLARPSAARLCVEIDLRKPPPPFIWVGLFEGFKQPVIYEKLPKFCSRCIAQGHTAVDCPTGQREATSKPADPHRSSIRGRTPPVRHYASRQSPSNTDLQYAPPATLHNPTIPSPPPPPPHPTPLAATTHFSASTSDAEDIDRSLSSHIDSVHNVYSVSRDIQPRPPPPTNAPIDDSSNPAVVNQSTAMQVLQPRAKIPESSPKQQKSVASAHHHAPSSQQSSSPVAAPPPPPGSSSSCPLEAAPHPINSNPIDPHRQPQPSAARSPAAAVPSTSHASSQPTPVLPSAAASAVGSAIASPDASSIPSVADQSTHKHAHQTPVKQPKSSKFPPISLRPSSKLPPQSSLRSENQLKNPPAAPKKHKTVSFENQQLNVESNQAYWETVNRQMAILDQARLKAPLAVTAISSSSSRKAAMQAYQSEDESDSDFFNGEADLSPPPQISFYDELHPFEASTSARCLSEGEDHPESQSLLGHATDDESLRRPSTFRRNKRHPDQPLKVKLRARKHSNPHHV